HLDYQSNLRLGLAGQNWGQHIFTFAFEWDRENGFLKDFASTQAPTRAQRDNFGGTFQYQMAIGRFFLTNGVRVEQNGSFGRAVVPRSSAAYLLRRGSGRLGATKLRSEERRVGKECRAWWSAEDEKKKRTVNRI